ncbi:MAG: SDR family oxidoreductase [Sphingobacteriia bacterium]
MSKNVLITGASGGFGTLTTKLLLQKGYAVVATMRNASTKNKDVAAELQAAGAKIVEIDVTSTDSVNAGVQKAIELLGSLDIVINNAGVGCAGMIEHFTPEDMQRLFDINVFGIQRINRAVLPHMRQQGSGLIVYISSLLGRITMPFYGIYNASKWAVEAMAENYRAELSSFGVEQAIIEPGGYLTGFVENLVVPSDISRVAAYGDFMNVPQQMGAAFFEFVNNTPQQRPERVAEAILALLEAPAGQRPFRTPVDFLGMADALKPYNDQLAAITEGLYKNMQLDGLLKVQQKARV